MTGLARGALALAVVASAQEEPRFRERVEVERVLVEVRVLDGRWPVTSLGREDFELRVGGKPVPLESAHWVPASAAPAGEERALAGEPPGRIVVFLVQKDLSESTRVSGLLRMLHHAQGVLDSLPASDRVAVASFDSHLKLWTDAGYGRAEARRALRHSVLFERRPAPIAAEPGGLADRFDASAGRKAASMETALLVLGEALRGLPGPKVVVFLGWGFGRFGPFGVSLEHDYDAARRALLAAHATVFTLDVSEADYHSLEVGLQQLASDTSGFYGRTYTSTYGSLARLRAALAGHYVLAFERPADAGDHRLEVRLRHRRGTVLAQTHYVAR